MSQVVGGLEFALKLLASEEDSQVGTTQKERTYMSNEGSDLHFTRSHTYKESTISTRPSTQEQPFSGIGNQRTRSYSCQNFKIYI